MYCSIFLIESLLFAKLSVDEFKCLCTPHPVNVSRKTGTINLMNVVIGAAYVYALADWRGIR